MIVEDDQGKAEEAQCRRDQTDHQGQGGGGSRRSRVVQQPRGRAGGPAEWHSDDQPVLHESRSDPKGGLHLSSLLSRSVPGLRDGEVCNGYAEADQGRRFFATSRTTIRSVLPTPSSRTSRRWAAPLSVDRKLQRRRHGFQCAADIDKGEKPAGNFRSRLLHRGRTDCATGKEAGNHRSVARRRRLGLAEADRDWREGSRRVFLLESLFRG